jgi:branched-chain amino acid aminotransferase
MLEIDYDLHNGGW